MRSALKYRVSIPSKSGLSFSRTAPISGIIEKRGDKSQSPRSRVLVSLSCATHHATLSLSLSQSPRSRVLVSLWDSRKKRGANPRVSIPSKSGLSFSLHWCGTQEELPEFLSQSPRSRVLVSLEKRGDKIIVELIQVSIPSKSGLSFSPQEEIPEFLREKLWVSIPSKSGLSFSLYGKIEKRGDKVFVVSIPSKSGLSFSRRQGWEGHRGAHSRSQSPRSRVLVSLAVPSILSGWRALLCLNPLEVGS